MTRSLLELPPELVENIVEHVVDLHTLRSLALTCSQLRPLAERHLYASVTLRDLRHVSQLHRALLARVERADAISSVECVGRHGFTAGEYAPRSIVHAARNIEKLTLESPYCNDRIAWRDDSEWQTVLPDVLRGLGASSVSGNHFSRLTDLTIHWSGRATRHWQMTPDLIGIFRHDTLKTLTLSCLEIEQNALDDLKGQSATPLTSLVLIECRVHLDAISVILSLPRALRRLELGQSAHHFRASPRNTVHEPHTYQIQDPSKFFDALKKQRRSLEHFTYIEHQNTNLTRLPVYCDGFIQFDELKTIILDGECAFVMHAIKEKSTAPPNLQILTLKDRRHGPLVSSPVPRDSLWGELAWLLLSAKVIQSLQKATLMTFYDYFNPPPGDYPPESERERIKQMGKMFEAIGTHLSLLRINGRGYIPPILYDEKDETNTLVYSSETEQFASRPLPSTWSLSDSDSDVEMIPDIDNDDEMIPDSDSDDEMIPDSDSDNEESIAEPEEDS